MSRELAKTGRWMLVILFLSYYISTTMFYHTHHFYWGTVTHSHPYFPFDKNSTNHTHTPAQCLTINILSALLLTFFVASAIICRTDVVKKIIIRVHSYKSLFQVVFSPLRAPPVFICK